jgi:arylsulfatase
LTVAFFAPHSWDGHPEQFLPQNETFHVYEDITISPPYDMEASFKRLPKLFKEHNEGRNRYRHRFDNPQKYDKMMKNYFRLITGIDTACKAVWDELESQGILNETMFIFTTDNGFYHGEHGLAGKWYPHEESIRVPLVVYDPRMPVGLHGTTNDEFTLNVDLAPTILGAANLTPSASMQGRDFSDLYLRPDSPPWRTEFFYEHPVHLNKEIIPASTALVRKGIKYIDWPGWDTEVCCFGDWDFGQCFGSLVAHIVLLLFPATLQSHQRSDRGTRRNQQSSLCRNSERNEGKTQCFERMGQVKTS